MIFPRNAVLALGALIAAGTTAVAQTTNRNADPFGPLIREAIRANLDLAQQRFGERAADAAVREARAFALPSLSFESRRSELSGGVNLGDLVNPAYRTLNQLTGTSAFPTNVDLTLPFAQESRLRFTQAIYQPAIAAGVSAASNARDAQHAQLRAAARRLAADVQASYWAVASADRVAELYRVTMPLMDENVRVNERLLANGKVTAEPVLRARAERSEIVQQLAEAEQRRSAAGRAFNLLLNRPLETPVELLPDSVVDVAIDLSIDELIRRARAGREELRQAEYGIRASDAQERAATAAFLPGLVLAVDYGFQGDTYRFDRQHDALIASLALQWNVFNGGRDAARREQAVMDGRRARVARQDLERRIELDVRQSYDAARVARASIGTAQDRLAAAKRSFELVSRRYDEGMASQVEFIDARTAYTRAGLNLILTRQSYATRCADLERAAALRSLEF